ncbi:MAG: T9SS type A sorting domain-containing protein [Flavobacteriales bacterium]
MHTYLRTLALALPLTFGLKANALNVDITMVSNGDGGLDVKVRPTEHFEDIVSTLLFTIRWSAASDAHLGALTQNATAGVYAPMVKSDAETDAGGYRYQIFSCMGFTPLHALSTEWNAGQEYTIASIPVAGVASFVLIVDGWTQENNGNYYVALGGAPSTGEIYEMSTGIQAGDGLAVGLDIQPNPTDKDCTIRIDSEKARAVDMELFNPAGQVVLAKRIALSAGRTTETLHMEPYGRGVYMLRLRSDKDVMTRRIVRR